MSASPEILTLHLFLADSACRPNNSPELGDLLERMRQHNIACVLHGRDAQPPEDRPHEPAVFVSVGGGAADFPGLYGLPMAYRRRWLHVKDCLQIDPKAVIFCWLSATDPLPSLPPLPVVKLPAEPLVSVFTAAYRSGERLQRPYRSLLAQTYANWQWVVVDDSGDDCQTFRQCIAPMDDARVVKVMLAQHVGRIGSVKRIAAGICRGEILVELDHDDELTPDALERIVAAFVANPDCGFVFGECAEIYEGTHESHWYGWDAGFGYSMCWRQYDEVTGGFVNVQRTPDTNDRTIRHLVGLPNHPRAWTRALYEAVGGHRSGLIVADDFDLLLRSFLVGRYARVPHLMYLQYRNAGGGNTTFTRNRQIQLLCSVLEQCYRERVERRLRELNVPATRQLPYRRIWTCADADPRWVAANLSNVDHARARSELFVLPYGDLETARALDQCLQAAQAACWEGWEIVVVGDVPEQRLEEVARRAPAGALRWWRTERPWPLADVARYGRRLCAGPIRAIHGLEPRITDDESNCARVPLRYVDKFVLASPRDHGLDRLHLLHWLQTRYGYGAYLEIGTDRDEVFSQMRGFRLKVGVDPNAGGTHRMTSDAYFESIRQLPEASRAHFDLVFIDGLHEHQQVLRDLENALACLLPGGTIVLHDCMPCAESQQAVPRPVPLSFWTGDVWKAIFQLRRRPDLDIAVGRFDWGVAVLRVRPNSKPFDPPPGAWDWSYYVQHREAGLNTMSYDDLLAWIDC